MNPTVDSDQRYHNKIASKKRRADKAILHASTRTFGFKLNNINQKTSRVDARSKELVILNEKKKDSEKIAKRRISSSNGIIEITRLVQKIIEECGLESTNESGRHTINIITGSHQSGSLIAKRFVDRKSSLITSSN